MNCRVYLAGPDVFLPDAKARGESLKAICARHGLVGVFPLDNPDTPLAATIATGNEALIRSCAAVIANLTPFRGVSADAGTAYEVGFARALGLPVFAFTADPRSYAARCATLEGAVEGRDAEGFAIEMFDLPENLMIACAVTFCGDVEGCAAAAAAALGAQTPLAD